MESVALSNTIDILQGAYAVLGWLRGTDLYITGYQNVLEMVSELYKEYRS